MDWPIYQLVDVTGLITCGVAKRPNYVDSGVPFLSAKNVKNGKIIWSGYQNITKEDHDELTKNNKPLRGDILYTRVGSFGEAAIVDKDAEFSVFVSLTLIKPKHEIMYNQFLKYYLNSSQVKQLAKSSISGSGVGNLNVGTVRKFPIPVPPIPEQQRIVAILDQAFADIEKARANAEKNLKNARELFDSYLHKTLTESYAGATKPLKDVAYTAGRIGWKGLTAKEYVEHGPLFLSVHSLNYGQYIDIRDANHITQERYDESPEIMLEEGDILICKDGAGIGKVGIIKEIEHQATINSSLLLIRSNDKIKSKYLYYYFTSPLFQKIVKQRIEGATTPHLYQREIKEFDINIPSLQEQENLVNQFDNLFIQTKSLSTKYENKLKSLEELKNSLLQKAFSGELTKDKGIAA
jgi:type I restriction enzyme S subunit